MLKRCLLLLLFLNFVITTDHYIASDDALSGFSRRYSFWPSVHNAATLLRVRREQEPVLNSEGGAEEVRPPTGTGSTTQAPQLPQNTSIVKDVKPENSTSTQMPTTTSPKPVTSEKPTLSNVTSSTTVSSVLVNNTTETNSTSIKKPVNQLDLNNPGVLKRGFIVFGGFALLAIAYYIFYRRKSKNNETNNTHNTNDTNQFRYGVLQSEDRRDTELSRIPLTMESDDDEEDDMDIFDLEQKKKSLSYVNLQTNDEDVVFSLNDDDGEDKGDLLLDIEDGTSETLINWSSNGNKSIL